MKLMENVNRLGVLIEEKHNEMEDLKKQEETRQQRIFKAKEDLAAAELELENLTPYEPPTDEIVSYGFSLKMSGSTGSPWYD
ncbi:hypothetical protein ACFX13_029192 [Malus domestica]